MNRRIWVLGLKGGMQSFRLKGTGGGLLPGIAGFLWTLLAVTAYGQYAVQTVTLAKGWNAVYLQVEPEDPRCLAVFADWPVTSVSLYNMEHAFAQYTESPDEPVNRRAEFLTWEPGLPEGANDLNRVIAGHAYLIFATAGCQRALTGRPAVPRIEWVPGTNACNLVGFRQQATATFGTYLSGAGFDGGKLSVYAVGGTNSSNPTLQPVGAFTGLNTAPIEQGKAYFIVCDKVSSFSGPVKVSPEGTGGIFFPSNGVYQTLRLKNEHGAPLTVTLSAANSAAAPSGAVPVLPVLHAFDYLEGWQPLTSRARTLQAGEEWTLPLAVDRTGMVADQAYGGLLVCADEAGGRVEIPLEAEYGQPDATHALWPAGLWVGGASLGQVSQVLADGTVVADAKAGGTLEFRLILHVGKDKRCRLLQRVIIAGAEETNGTWNASLYVDEAKVPLGVRSARISSVAFGLKNNDIIWDDTYYGDRVGFGKNLRFTYTLAADDPVNPFRHPYHPDHDGLDARFKTRLPTGDNPNNYIGAIKPELFSVSNTVTLAWTNAAVVGGSSVLWNPAEKVTGTIEFQVDGLRREGAILMKGAFELRRISQVGTLSLE